MTVQQQPARISEVSSGLNVHVQYTLAVMPTAVLYHSSCWRKIEFKFRPCVRIIRVHALKLRTRKNGKLLNAVKITKSHSDDGQRFVHSDASLLLQVAQC